LPVVLTLTLFCPGHVLDGGHSGSHLVLFEPDVPGEHPHGGSGAAGPYRLAQVRAAPADVPLIGGAPDLPMTFGDSILGLASIDQDGHQGRELRGIEGPAPAVLMPQFSIRPELPPPRVCS
jgi:hypothetical protein